MRVAIRLQTRIPLTSSTFSNAARSSVGQPGTRSDMRRSAGVSGPVIRICGSSR